MLLLFNKMLLLQYRALTRSWFLTLRARSFIGERDTLYDHVVACSWSFIFYSVSLAVFDISLTQPLGLGSVEVILVLGS